MIHYVCKYTPTELFQGFGEKCAVLEEMPENFEMSDQIAHANHSADIFNTGNTVDCFQPVLRQKQNSKCLQHEFHRVNKFNT